MFTKQYPSGVILEGYYTDFSIPESSEDAQTISYSFNFTVENIKPVTLVQRIAGMYADYGSVVGDLTSTASGFF